MANSISSSRASVALMSQPITPKPPVTPPAESGNSGVQSVNSVASELLALNSEGPVGRVLNQLT